MFGMVLGSILIALFGVFLLLKTEVFWQLTEQWKAYGADEPSEFYLKVTKLGGAVFIVVGVVFLVLSFIVG